MSSTHLANAHSLIQGAAVGRGGLTPGHTYELASQTKRIARRLSNRRFRGRFLLYSQMKCLHPGGNMTLQNIQGFVWARQEEEAAEGTDS